MGDENCKIIRSFLGGLPIHLFRHFRYRMCGLATMHSLAVRWYGGP